MARTGRDDIVVRAPGLSKLRRDLKKIDRDLGREAPRHVRRVANQARHGGWRPPGPVPRPPNQVRDEARSRAPKKTGRLSKSIRTSVRSKGASIYSPEEYAGVHEFGGTISPKGTPIEIEGQRFIYGAIDEKADDVAEQLGDLLDHIADTNGF
jgi:phage gpG-like protein